jgi:phosphoglycolate phosphatase
VATTKPTDRATEQLRANALLPRFHHVQGTDVGMEPKPHPDVIMHACRALEVDPRHVVMVGDTLRDVMAAKAAGAFSVAIAYDEEAELRARRFEADLVVRSVEELEEL